MKIVTQETFKALTPAEIGRESDCAVGLYGYDSGLKRVGSDQTKVNVEDHARELATTIRDSPFKRVILVGHSMGGLLAKGVAARLIETNSQRSNFGRTVERIHGLFLLATPQAGAKGVFGFFGSSADKKALELHGPYATRLAELFADSVSSDLRNAVDQRERIPVYAAGVTSDRWVTRLSAPRRNPLRRRRPEGSSRTSRVGSCDPSAGP